MKYTDNTTPHKAVDYDEKVRRTIPNYEFYHEETISLVKTARPDAEAWLDTGCGTGFLIWRAFEHFPQTRFILADPSPDMLNQTQKRLAGFPEDRIKIIEPAGTEDIPESHNESMDVITALQCHHYLGKEERARATNRCNRLLREGGLYVALENIHPYTDRGVEIGLARWSNFQLSQGRSHDTVEKHGLRFNTKYFPITVDEHISLLKRAGFQVAELFYYTQMQAGFYAIK